MFLFSASLWLPHRIHYDREYTRAEGHEDLLVHGPLQAAIATEMVGRHVRSSDLRISHISFRHVAPAFVNSELVFSVQAPGLGDAEGSFDVEVRDTTTGRMTTVGMIEVSPIGQPVQGALRT